MVSLVWASLGDICHCGHVKVMHLPDEKGWRQRCVATNLVEGTSNVGRGCVCLRFMMPGTATISQVTRGVLGG